MTVRGHHLLSVLPGLHSLSWCAPFVLKRSTSPARSTAHNSSTDCCCLLRCLMCGAAGAVGSAAVLCAQVCRTSCSSCVEVFPASSRVVHCCTCGQHHSAGARMQLLVWLPTEYRSVSLGLGSTLDKMTVAAVDRGKAAGAACSSFPCIEVLHCAGMHVRACWNGAHSQ